MANKANLDNSRRNKNDEYYTYREDVVKGLEPYLEYLQGKTVLCPCDTEQSEFVKYLTEIGCKVIHHHEQNGSEWFKPNDYDVCVTNPPFSKIKDFYNTYKDKPLIFVCTLNHLMYKELCPDWIEGKLSVGYATQNMYFNANGEHKGVSLVMVANNIGIKFSNTPLKLSNEVPNEYIKGTDILNINKTKDIPTNYSGLMAVPISYYPKHCSKQFEIIGIAKHGSDHVYDLCKPIVNDKEKFTRLIIKSVV